MTIDYKQVKAEAKAGKISEILLMKRKSGYRKIKDDERLKNQSCMNCKLCTQVKFENTPEKNQCYWLGVKDDPHAEVKAGYICKHYKKAYQGE